METLTKEQRLAIYMAMLFGIKRMKAERFFEAIEYACAYYNWTPSTINAYEQLPELMEHKPKELINGDWVEPGIEGRLRRIEILKSIINKLKMNKKILKEVSLLNDYRDYRYFIPANTPLKYSGNYKNNWDMKTSNGTFVNSYTQEEIMNCKTDLFKFTTEPEEFIFRNNIAFTTSDEINRLADWCDERSQAASDKNIYSIILLNGTLLPYCSNSINSGIKLNSAESAYLFIEELNKLNNFLYKKYFIELLTKRRI